LISKVVSKKYINRNQFLNSFPENTKILEIGPFTIPSVIGSNVDYFDVLSKEQLIEYQIVKKDHKILTGYELPELKEILKC
jgi:hypothetical protein